MSTTGLNRRRTVNRTDRHENLVNYCSAEAGSVWSVDYMGNGRPNDPWSKTALQVGYQVNYCSVLQASGHTSARPCIAHNKSAPIPNVWTDFNRGLT